MLTLAVDTAADTGSIALVDRSRTLEEIRLHAKTGFGQVIFGELEALLARQRVALPDIELYAAATGPGSFTGVRVGLAVIKGLAAVAGKPAIGVSNLVALAEFGSAPLRAPVIDAKRSEVFAALYDESGAELIPAAVLPFRDFLAAVAGRPAEFITAGYDCGQPVTPAPLDLASVIARLAIARYRAGEPSDPAAIEANYVRRSDAEIFFKP